MTKYFNILVIDIVKSYNKKIAIVIAAYTSVAFVIGSV